MNPRSPIATALLGLCASPTAWSQTLPDDPVAPPTVEVVPASKLPPVVVRAVRDTGAFTANSTSLDKLPADLRDAPQSVTVLNKALLQSQGATSLADALRNVPGITLGGAEGGQIGNNINLNGFTARTDIYLDGFRDRGQYYRDIFALDSVEVLMGPSSVLFGRGSTGGVINQVSKKSVLGGFDEFSTSVISNGLVRGTVDHDQAFGADAALRLSAFGQSGRPTTRDQTQLRDVGVAPSLRLGIGTPTEITLSALLQHNDDMPDYGISPLNGRPVAVDRDRFYGYTDDRTIQDVVTLSAGVEHRFSPTGRLRNQTQYNDVRINAIETASNTIGTIGPNGFAALKPAATSSLPLDQLGVRLQSHDRVIHDKSLFHQTELTTHLGTGFFQHDLLIGTEIGRDTYTNQGYYRNGSCNGVTLNPAGGTAGYAGCEPLVNPAYTGSPATALRSTGNLASAAANTLAAYANDTFAIGAHWKLVGGIRQDHYQARVENSVNRLNTAGSTAFQHLGQTVNFTSVRVGGLWQPSQAQSYYASYSTSFNPSLEQLTSTTGISAPLPPEQNRAYEVGGKWDVIAQRVSLNAAAFQITKDNARSQNADNTYSATGTVQVRGWRAGASGEPVHGWKLYAGYTRLNAEIVDAIAAGTQGRVPLNTPRDSAALWSTWEFAPHWEVGGGSTYQSSRYLNNTNQVAVGGYARVDATLAYRQKQYEIRLNVFNLADRGYFDNLIQSDGGRAVPGTGRTAMLTFTWRLPSAGQI